MTAFKFVAWADTKWDSTTGPKLQAESQSIIANNLNPTFTIYTGDLCSSGPSASCFNSWKNALNGGNNNGMFDKTFATRGNHEDAALPTVWLANFDFSAVATRIGATNYNEQTVDLTYSFDYDNSHFVCVDNKCTTLNGCVGDITTTTINWIDADITAAEAREIIHTFLFLHGPIYPVDGHCCSGASTTMITMLNKHSTIKAGFFGHEHVIAHTALTSSLVSGLTHNFEQFIIGRAGANHYSVNSNRTTDYNIDTANNGADGYALVTVNGSNWTVDIYTSAGTKVKTFTFGGASTLTTITLSPLTATKFVGQTQQLTTVCKDQNNIVMTCPTLTWSSDTPSVATVDSSGLVTTQSVGIAHIDAYNGSIHATTQSTITVQATSVLTTIVVSPTSASVAIDGTKQIIATAKDQNNNVMSGISIIWLLNPSTGTIYPLSGTTNSSGQTTTTFTGIFAGNSTIKAKGNNTTIVSNACTITVTSNPVVTTITLSPSNVTLIPGGTQSITATVLDQYNAPMNNVLVTWSNDYDTIGTIYPLSGTTNSSGQTSTVFTADATNTGYTSVHATANNFTSSPCNIHVATIPTSTELRFMTIGDPHISDDSNYSADLTRLTTIKDFVNTVPYNKLDFIVFLGDITDTPTDTEFTNAKNVVLTMNPRFYVVIGNHDLTTSGSTGKDKFETYFGVSKHIENIKDYQLIFVGLYKNIDGSLHWDFDFDSMTSTQKALPTIVFIHGPVEDSPPNDCTNWGAFFGYPFQSSTGFTDIRTKLGTFSNLKVVYAGHVHYETDQTFTIGNSTNVRCITNDALIDRSTGQCDGQHTNCIGYTRIRENGTVDYTLIPYQNCARGTGTNPCNYNDTPCTTAAFSDPFDIGGNNPSLGTFFYGWYTKSGESPAWHNWSECGNPDSGNCTDCGGTWNGTTNTCTGGTEIINCPATNDHSTMIPNRWAGRYLPMLGGTTNPSTELYSSLDAATMKTQLSLMKDAGIEFIIFSWWGQGTVSDASLDLLMNTVLPAADNPYPNIKVCIYYEKEGYADNSIALIKADIDYLNNHYISDTNAGSSYYFKINVNGMSKPVIWVYNQPALSFATKWNTIRNDKSIYTVLKEVPNWDQPANVILADCWHQYGPAVRYGKTGNFHSFVSPGFYRYHACARLLRCDQLNSGNGDYSDFEAKLNIMKNDGCKFHTIQTWNEWQESSGVEPAVAINHIEGGSGAFTVKGTQYQYGKAYINLIKHILCGNGDCGTDTGHVYDEGITLSAQSDIQATSVGLFATPGLGGVLSKSGAIELLNIIFRNQSSGQNLTMRLFSNNITPSSSDIFDTYISPSGGGYTTKTLTNGSWSLSAENQIAYATYPLQTWTFSGSLDCTTPKVYGYYVTDVNNMLIWAERFETPYIPGGVDSLQLSVTIKFRLNSVNTQ